MDMRTSGMYSYRWLVRDTGPLTDLAARAPCSAHLDRGRDPVLLHKQQHADTDGKRRRREPSVLVKGELCWFLGVFAGHASVRSR